MKLCYKVIEDDATESTTIRCRHITSLIHKGFSDYHFVTERLNNDPFVPLEFEIFVYGLFNGGDPANFDYFEADVFIVYTDQEKDFVPYTDLIPTGKTVVLEYETKLPFRFRQPFEYFHVHLKIFSKASHLSIKDEIKSLQLERDFEGYCKNNFTGEAIAIIGQKHCGSTMVFNLVRAIYRKIGKKVNETSFTDHDDIDVFVTKYHDKKEEEYDDGTNNRKKIKITKYISTCRDIRDSAISSFFRFYYNQSVNQKRDIRTEVLKCGLNYFLNSMLENILLYEKSLKNDPYIFVYEHYKASPLAEVKKLLSFLQIHMNDDDIIEIICSNESYFSKEGLMKDLKDYSIQKEQSLDKLLTKDHNTSDGKIQKWKTFFDDEQLSIIMEEPLIVNYLKEFKYL